MFDFEDALNAVESDAGDAIAAWGTADPSETLDAVLVRANAHSNGKTRRWSNPRYVRRVVETANVIKRIAKGAIPSYYLQETLSTSDFPIIFGDIIDRQMLGMYNASEPVWRGYLGTGTVRDFRQARRVALDGMEGPYYPQYQKAELESVKYDNSLTETGFLTQVQIYEKGYSLNWRMVINDDMDAMSQLAPRLARGAQRTESKFAVSLICGSGGYNSTYFSNANKNLINTTNGAASNNPALSVQGLRDAVNVLARQVDAGGDPIVIEAMTLVVPPALKVTALEILHATAVLINPGVTSGTGEITKNWLADQFTLVVDPYLPIVDGSANKHTTWYVFAKPDAGRPAAEVTFLRGYETPQVYQKLPDTMRVGSSTPDVMLGDFNDMSWHFKGVHIIGGTMLDTKMAVVSNGSGS
jgi:hypothetical protein